MNIGRRTPPEIFPWLHRRFGFTLAPCTTPDLPLGLGAFFTEEEDGLIQS